MNTFKEYEDFIIDIGKPNKEKDILVFLAGLLEEIGELYEHICRDIEFDEEDPLQMTLLEYLNNFLLLSIQLSVIKRAFKGDLGINNSKVKSINISPKTKEKITKEFGDKIAYSTLLGYCFDITLQNIIDNNESKLIDRRNRNTLRGSGDNR